MPKTQITPIIMLLVNVCLGSIGQLFLKYGASRLDQLHAGQDVASSLLDSLKGIFTPYVFTGFCFYAVSAVIWIRILRQVNLSFAYPMISMSYVVVVILSALIFREKIPWQTGLGLACICIGVSLIGIGFGTGAAK